MKYLLEVPDEMTPNSMNPNSVEERMKLIVAFKHSKQVLQIATPIGYVFTKDNKQGFVNPTCYIEKQNEEK